MRSYRTLPVTVVMLGLSSAASFLTACETESATHAVIENAYAAPPEGGDATQQTVVYRAWWGTTYFPNATPAGASSEEERSVKATDYAYAVLAVGWDPSSGVPPRSLIAVKSRAPLSAQRGDTLRIVVSDATFVGNCGAAEPLSQPDADFITERIFPAEFARSTYDAATCTMSSISDAGVDARTDDASSTTDDAQGQD